MLTRLQSGIKRDFRVFTRYLADKPSDQDLKNSKNDKKTASEEKNDSNKQKIQELLKLMMSESKNKEKLSEYPGQISKEAKNVQMDKIEESITKAAGEVAQALGGDVKQTESELLSKVLGKINQTSTNLSDLIIGMKVDRSKDETEGFVSKESRGQQVKRLVDRAKQTQQSRYAQRKDTTTQRIPRERRVPQHTQVNVFGGEALGIFNKTSEPNYGTKLDLWSKLKQREVALATSQPPANYFQKMINWTEQGKVWKFPINNEQGWEEEENIHFSEHIFLDVHLEDWCPKRGPIRHFMELVCVGLSKNAFYTAQEKKDHIMWYKEYFEGKKDLLEEVGAWDIKKSKEVSA